MPVQQTVVPNTNTKYVLVSYDLVFSSAVWNVKLSINTLLLYLFGWLGETELHLLHAFILSFM